MWEKNIVFILTVSGCYCWQSFKPADSLCSLSVWVQVCRSPEGHLMPIASLVNFLHSWGLDWRTTCSKQRENNSEVTLKELSTCKEAGHPSSTSVHQKLIFIISCWKGLCYLYIHKYSLHLLITKFYPNDPCVYEVDSV